MAIIEKSIVYWSIVLILTSSKQKRMDSTPIVIVLIIIMNDKMNVYLLVYYNP